MLLHFNDYLQVTYIKAKEPEEYLAYKGRVYVEKNIINKNELRQMMRGYPITGLSLTQGNPLKFLKKVILQTLIY